MLLSSRTARLLAGASFITLFSMPVLAQECAQEVDRLETEVTASDLPDNQKNEIQTQLDEASKAQEGGDEQTCLDMVGAVESLVPTAAAATAEETVDATARLEVEQAQPQVSVKQKPPKVIVKIGKPVVTVRIPEPEVTVDMPEPEIIVEQQDPDVNVVMAEPQIAIAGQETDNSEATEPTQAMVSVERDEQGPDIQLEQEEPEVKVEQAEATVNVTRSEQPDDPAAEAEPNRLSIAGMAPTDIVGTNVINSEDETIAEISEVVKEANGERLFAVLSVGGFLGLGDKDVAIPLDRFDVKDDGTFVLQNQTEEELEAMQAYEPDGYTPVSQDG